LVELFYSQKTEDKFWGAKLLLDRISANGSTELAEVRSELVEGSGTLLVSQKPNPFFDFAPFALINFSRWVKKLTSCSFAKHDEFR